MYNIKKLTPQFLLLPVNQLESRSITHCVSFSHMDMLHCHSIHLNQTFFRFHWQLFLCKSSPMLCAGFKHDSACSLIIAHTGMSTARAVLFHRNRRWPCYRDQVAALTQPAVLLQHCSS